PQPVGPQPAADGIAHCSGPAVRGGAGATDDLQAPRGAGGRWGGAQRGGHPRRAAGAATGTAAGVCAGLQRAGRTNANPCTGGRAGHLARRALAAGA
ncbi:hypothetical protein ABTM83_19120, partial [Acinetobacter baumannii]